MPIKCSYKDCGHTNVDGTSYCVKCGRLLGGMYEKKVVIKAEYEKMGDKIKSLEQEKKQLEDCVKTLTNTDKVRIEQIQRQQRKLDDINEKGSAPTGYELISKTALEEERKNVLAHVSNLKQELDDIKKKGFAPKGYHLEKDKTLFEIISNKTIRTSEYNELRRKANQSWYGKLWDTIKDWWDDSAFGIALAAILISGAMVVYFTTDGIVKSCSKNPDEVSVKIEQRDGLWGMVKGKDVLLPFEYDSIVTDKYDTKFSRIYKGEHVGLINNTIGKEIVPCIYLEVGEPNNVSLRGKLIALKKDGGKWQYVDYSGLPTGRLDLYDYAKWWSNADMGIVGVRINGEMKYGYADSSGFVKIPCKYVEVQSLFEGLALVKKAKYGSWICINEKGEEQYKLKYGLCDVYHESLMAVSNDSKWTSKTLFGFVDRKGELVIPMHFTPWVLDDGRIYYPRFDNGKAFLHYNGKKGRIDKEGNYTEIKE